MKIHFDLDFEDFGFTIRVFKKGITLNNYKYIFDLQIFFWNVWIEFYKIKKNET